MQISPIKSAVLLSAALQKRQEIPPAPRHQLPLSLAKALLSTPGGAGSVTINGKSSEEKLSNYFLSLKKSSVHPFSLGQLFGGAAQSVGMGYCCIQGHKVWLHDANPWSSPLGFGCFLVEPLPADTGWNAHSFSAMSLFQGFVTWSEIIPFAFGVTNGSVFLVKLYESEQNLLALCKLIDQSLAFMAPS